MRYFFDLDGEGVITVDAEGTECHTLQQLRKTALDVLTEVVAHAAQTCDGRTMVVRVRSSDDQIIYEACANVAGRLLVEAQEFPLHRGRLVFTLITAHHSVPLAPSS